MAVQYRDLAGNEIEVGSLIVYAALWGRSAQLHYGRVIARKEREPSSYAREKGPTPTLRVLAVDRDYSDKWMRLNKGSVITLGFMDRVLVVPENAVPAGALELL